MRAQRKLLVLAAVLLGTVAPIEADATTSSGGGLDRTRLVSGLVGAQGSTIGPGGALYVTEGSAGRIRASTRGPARSRPSPAGSRARLRRIGGAIDVAFLGRTAYVLVTLVGPDVGGSDVVGIYRIDGPDSFTVVADIGAFALANPPATDFFVPTGVQYALEPYRGGFLVTDGHHNRVLWCHARRRDQRA